MFELSQIRCFVAVAQELHFGRAAAKLNMTQPPLSRQIQLLEHTLGVKLLERTSRTVNLTQAGRLFVPEALKILDICKDTATKIKHVAEGREGVLSIGFTALSGYHVLPKILRECTETYPGAELVLKEMISVRQVDELRSGSVDAGFLRPPIPKPLKSFVALREDFLLAVPEGHRWASGPLPKMKELDGEPFIMYSPSGARYFHDVLIRIFEDAEITPLCVHQLVQAHSILSLVGAGLGCALVPQSAAKLYSRGVSLRRFEMERRRTSELHFAWNPKNENPLIEPFVALVQNVLAQA